MALPCVFACRVTSISAKRLLCYMFFSWPLKVYATESTEYAHVVLHLPKGLLATSRLAVIRLLEKLDMLSKHLQLMTPIDPQ